MPAPLHPANVRDLGGLLLLGGGTTRSGVLLRGDAPYDGDGPPPGIDWPPSTVIDLRAARERDWAPYAWPAGTVVHHKELYDAGDLSAVPEVGGLMAVYRGMIDTAASAIAGLVDVVPWDGPTLLHCTAGKDRTGVSVAALLLLAGVEERAVVADYVVTEAAMERIVARMHARQLVDAGRIRADWALAPAEAVGLLVGRVTTWPGGVRGWFLDHGASAQAIDRFTAAFTR